MLYLYSKSWFLQTRGADAGTQGNVGNEGNNHTQCLALIPLYTSATSKIRSSDIGVTQMVSVLTYLGSGTIPHKCTKKNSPHYVAMNRLSLPLSWKHSMAVLTWLP